MLPNRSALEQGKALYVWDTKIVPQLSTYMGSHFEELCRQFIQLYLERWTHRVSALSARPVPRDLVRGKAAYGTTAGVGSAVAGRIA